MTYIVNPIQAPRTRMEMPAHLEALIHKPVAKSKLATPAENNNRAAYEQKLRQIAEERREKKNRILREVRRRKKLKRIGDAIRSLQRMNVDDRPAYMRHPERHKRILEIYLEKIPVSKEELFGSCRDAKLVKYRHVLFWMLRRNTKLSYPQIGRDFDRDHTTIIHGMQKVEKRKWLKSLACELEREVLVTEKDRYGGGI